VRMGDRERASSQKLRHDAAVGVQHRHEEHGPSHHVPHDDGSLQHYA